MYINGLFDEMMNGELAYTHDTVYGAVDNVMVPVRWRAWWRRGDEIPWDPSNTDGYRQPEMKPIPSRPPYLAPPRIHEGHGALAYHAMWGVYVGGVLQSIDVKRGDTVRLEAQAHGWCSNDNDPYHSQTGGDLHDQIQFWLGIDPTGGEDPFADSVQWGTRRAIFDAYEPVPAVEVVAQEPQVTLFLASRTKFRLKHNDSYWDSARVTVRTPDQPTEDPAQYRRRYLVVPPRVPDGEGGYRLLSEVEWMRAAAWAWRHEMMTMGNSVDDALIGEHLEDRGALLAYPVPDAWDEVGGREAIEEYRDRRYPGAHILDDVILYDDEDEGDGGPEPDPDPPEEPGDNAQPRPTTLNIIGLHAREEGDGMRDYVTSDQPPLVIKSIHLSDLVRMKRAVRDRHQRDVLSVFRVWVPNDHEWVLDPDKAGSAAAFLDLYSGAVGGTVEALRVHEPGLGIRTEEDLLQYVDVFESVNETIGTYDPKTPHTVEFEVEFIGALERRYGDLVRAGALRIAIGNPDIPEFSKLLPALRAIYRGGHYLAAHQSYWGTLPQGESFTAQLTPDDRAPEVLEFGGWHWYMDDDGVWHTERGPRPQLPPMTLTYTSGLERFFPWLAGRWMVYDQFCRAHGLFPLHYSGEGGALASHHDAGPGTLGGSEGWRDAGPFDPFILDQIRTLARYYLNWNERFGHRFRGVSYFTNPWWGWDRFWLDGPQLDVLRQVNWSDLAP